MESDGRMRTVEQALDHAEELRTIGGDSPALERLDVMVLATEVKRLREIVGELADPTVKDAPSWQQVKETFGEGMNL